MLKLVLLAVLAMMVSVAPLSAQAQSADAQDKKIAELQAKIDKLEARVAALEKQLAGAAGKSAQADGQASDAVKQQLQQQARARMRKDRDKYTQQQIAEAEELYQVANKNWRSPEAKTALEQLIARFPDLDRTGCAVLYLAQTTDGPDKELLLKEAIEKHGDCFYGNGVQVGALGRYMLAMYYKESGDNDKAMVLFEEIRKSYPNSIDHKGKMLVALIPKD